MTMLDVLNQALDDIDENFHNFLLRYRNTAQVVYGFVEGKDDPLLYKSIIDSRLPLGWHVDLLRAGNKRNVLRTYSTFDWNRFPPTRVCFFIDRDLDHYVDARVPASSNIFVTDMYSIENEVANPDVFLRLLSEVGGIVDTDIDEEDALRARFRAALEFFTDSMCCIMSQIIIWRRESRQCNLSNVDLRPIYLFSDGELLIRAGFEHEEARVRHCAASVAEAPSSIADLSQSRNDFTSREDWRNFVRGKYVTWFFANYYNTVQQNISRICRRYTKSPKSKVTIGPANIMQVAGPRTRAPSSLTRFIEENYMQFVENAAQSS